MDRPDAARNLLFGLLAFQNGFIDRDALLGTFATWIEDKTRSIADLLVGRGALSPEFRAALDPLVEAHIRARQVRLVIIDPFMAYLGGECDAHKDADVRRVMHKMKQLAERTADDEMRAALGDRGTRDAYLWGRDLLVSPVVEKGAASRRLYLPKGTWVDFWTEQRVEGGREIERVVDLATLPLHVRAGAIAWERVLESLE